MISVGLQTSLQILSQCISVPLCIESLTTLQLELFVDLCFMNPVLAWGSRSVRAQKMETVRPIFCTTPICDSSTMVLDGPNDRFYSTTECCLNTYRVVRHYNTKSNHQKFFYHHSSDEKIVDGPAPPQQPCASSLIYRHLFRWDPHFRFFKNPFLSHLFLFHKHPSITVDSEPWITQS